MLDGSAAAPGFQFADESAVINIVDQEACLSYAQEKQVDGVLTAATDYGVLAMSRIAEVMNLPAINFASAETIKNKFLVRKALFEAHADDTQQAYEITCDDDIIRVTEVVKLPVMVKPCDGSGSRGASKVEKIEDFRVACLTAMNSSLTHKAVVESFVVGKEYGVESYVYQGEPHVLAIMRKWMTEAPYYAELGHSIPSRLDPETEKHIKKCVEKAIRALGINHGSVNMDILLSENGAVHIVDVGARMGGNLIGSHIIPIGTGIDYMANMIHGAIGDDVELIPTTVPQCIVTRILALTPGIVVGLPDFTAIEKEYQVEIHHHLVAGSTINEYRTNLDGCGYVVAVSNDYDTAVTNAELALKRIDNEIIRANSYV